MSMKISLLPWKFMANWLLFSAIFHSRVAKASFQSPGVDSSSKLQYPTSDENAGSYRSEECSIFSKEQHSAFKKDGFLVVSNLLAGDIDALIDAGEDLVQNTKQRKSFFSSIQMGLIFEDETVQGSSNLTDTQVFRQIALKSIIPQAVAELMGLSKDQNLRVLRDVFMSKDVQEESVCGWHVDDVGFWPESYLSEHEGINVWIALEDMPANAQGSMALAPGSHNYKWKYDAYASIGQNRSFHGGFTRTEMESKANNGEKLLSTCAMHEQAPDISRKFDEKTFIPDIKKGDIIFATRTLFHRTLPVTAEGKKFYSERSIKYLNRYSIRYVPGTARLPQGWTFEWSIKDNKANAGKTLNQAMKDSRPWYPQVWPEDFDTVETEMASITVKDLDEIKAQTQAELFELFSLFTGNL